MKDIVTASISLKSQEKIILGPINKDLSTWINREQVLQNREEKGGSDELYERSKAIMPSPTKDAKGRPVVVKPFSNQVAIDDNKAARAKRESELLKPVSQVNDKGKTPIVENSIIEKPAVGKSAPPSKPVDFQKEFGVTNASLEALEKKLNGLLQSDGGQLRIGKLQLEQHRLNTAVYEGTGGPEQVAANKKRSDEITAIVKPIIEARREQKKNNTADSNAPILERPKTLMLSSSGISATAPSNKGKNVAATPAPVATNNEAGPVVERTQLERQLIYANAQKEKTLNKNSPLKPDVEKPSERPKFHNK